MDSKRNQYANKARQSNDSRVRDGTSSSSGNNNPPNDINSNVPVNESEPQDPTQSQQFTMLPPNPSRHSKLKMMAEKEEQDFQRYKEAHRPGPIHLNPERLGGAALMAEARERQMLELRQSKVQKQLKREEMLRKKRQEEEEEIQRMKAIQREKAKKLEEKKKQEEQFRRQQQRENHFRMTEQFFQRFERTGPAPVASSSTAHVSPWTRVQENREVRRAEESTALQLKKDQQRKKSESLEVRQRAQDEEQRSRVQLEHRLVNSAFLDRLEARGLSELERPLQTVEESSRDRPTGAPEPQDPILPPEPDPAQGASAGPEAADADYDWVVMKLQTRFPDFHRAFLEDIALQCNGDFLQACQLLQ